MDNLKVFRKSKNLTQLELAEKVGCSKIMISSIEQGVRTGTIELLKKIAEVLDCKIDDLI
jgi:transcriptional regulator with XRE-family HTH domain